jgi:cell division protein ZapA (FtsZ GTPase activity inhibitor)
MEKTTHKVKVAGATYCIVSDDTPEYMSALAKEVDLKIDVNIFD